MSKRVLGLWNMGEGLFHALLSPDESKDIIRAALDQGINAFDSAFSYKNADNYLSAVLKERRIERNSVEIISKVMAVPTLEKKADTSLKRLGTDYVDILLLHWPSDDASIFESMKKLERIKHSGKALEIGVSNFPFELLAKTASDFDITYHERPLSVLWTKGWDEEKTLGLKTIAYSPLAMGILAKDEAELKSVQDARKDLEVFSSRHTQNAISAIGELADKYGITRKDAAISWVYKEAPEYIAMGASRKEHLLNNPVELSEEEMRMLSEIGAKIAAETVSDNIFSHSYLHS